MPAKLPFLKSNRSQASVGSSTGHSSSVSLDRQEGSGLQYQPQEGQQNRNPAQPFPPRSPTQKHLANVFLERPPVNVAASVNAAETSLSNDQPPENRYYNTYPSSGPPQPSPQPQEPKKSFRTRLGNVIGHTHRESADRLQPAGYNKAGVGRSISVRKKEAPTLNRYSSGEGQTRPYPQGWTQQQPGQHLAPSNEHDEGSELDPFLIQPGQQSPAVPPKDSPYGERYGQQQFSRPSLARVNTNPEYLSHSSEHHSPEQNSGGTRHSVQYQNHSPLRPQQEEYRQYQAYIDQQASNQNPAGASQFQQQVPDVVLQQQHQQHNEELRLYQQQQAFEQYQQQQQSPRQHQHAGPDSQQGQQGQQGQQQDGFQGRPPSQQQQYSYHHGQYNHQGFQGPPPPPHQDTQYIQSLRPPSQQQQYAPSSSAGQHRQGFVTEGQSHIAKSPAPDTAPQQASGATPTEQTAGRSNFEAKQQGTFGPPSRQGSDGLEQPQPGRGHMPPSAPGIASFSANVVPPTSQGQPYKINQQQDGEMGRSTPPLSRGPSDMTEEDIVQLQKDYKELKEKYQKVKKYYFEKENQVHTLQNTLAHQRLSLSRTSLDDNEYCNRFNRLDGLISQLAFSIRKSWKSIPSWLAPAVNKDAISVGKQEMTAVGRAFISSWLVDEIFDKYFHPDIEPGLSSQLKLIQLAIRKAAPLTAQQSSGASGGSEEEEQLTARVINWRLATVEGLAEPLRSPQAAQNRQQLVANMHKKMKATLEMHLVDPAPADLDGGVHMIAELAVNVAVHLPLESRDVVISYFPPGHGIVADVMKLETTPIQPLTNPVGAAEGVEADMASLQSTGEALGEEKPGTAGSAQSSMVDAEGVSTTTGSSNAATSTSAANAATASAKEQSEGRRSRGLLGTFSALKQKTAGASSSAPVGSGGSQVSLVQQQQQQQGGATGPPKEDTPPRVRMAVGVAVQIRGRSVLVKAPVFST